MGSGKQEPDWGRAAWRCSDNWDHDSSASSTFSTAMSLAETFSPGGSSDFLSQQTHPPHTGAQQDADAGIGIVISSRAVDTAETLREIVVEDILKGGPADLLTDIQGGDTIITVSNVRVEGLQVGDVMRLVRV